MQQNRESRPPRKDWDPALYDGKNSFVWKYGEEVVRLLAPRPGERILDLGCGTGHLTNRISEIGADVVGIDNSAKMIGQARSAYPALRFELGDGQDFQFPEPFDAVFSNAAIHWMNDQTEVARCIWRALRPGGRFVAEFGGKGNIRALHTAVYRALEAAGYPTGEDRNFRYYPTVGEYATLLEAAGFLVTHAVHFERPTPLEGGAAGLRNWLVVFTDNLLKAAPQDRLESMLAHIEDMLRSELFRDGVWYADYRRIRVVAIKPN
jgi:trans-aconitate methyltransferase